MVLPVFDLHCDTALSLLGENLRMCGSLKKNNGHIDIERADAYSAYAQCFACFTSEAFGDIPPVDLFERELATIQRELERNQQYIRQQLVALCHKERGWHQVCKSAAIRYYPTAICL